MISLFQIAVDIEGQLKERDANLDLGNIISTIIPVTLIFSGIAVFLYIIWAGYGWLTSGGDQAKIEEARKIMAELDSLGLEEVDKMHAWDQKAEALGQRIEEILTQMHTPERI